jgi:hypothetical protein
MNKKVMKDKNTPIPNFDWNKAIPEIAKLSREKSNIEESPKIFSINEDEMQAIILIMRAIRRFSKYRTTESLLGYLQSEEILNRTDGRIFWRKPMLKLFKSIEDKFSNRLKEHGMKVLSKKV